jgi:3-oxoacyl-ACP reductase-like protein
VPVRISLKPSAAAAATAAATASAAAGAAADNTATNTGSTVAAVSALNAANSRSDVVSNVAPRSDVSVWIAGGSGKHNSMLILCLMQFVQEVGAHPWSFAGAASCCSLMLTLQFC